ncbi:signal recognition particle-docking protein FtsY [Endozoicomonas sp. SM1973]|uniref:Signal recognition particle receptor FtsY n=1 Tax=Spartinivicinus marinus TaxID=2994442 RepID=A0A853I4C3_9GAMM|nr:signal recognition particle-docking protein FtsY [Spartinivicinus marinus]MCX4026603.1 signal recognition particle-docking protein FtsY [Spartinivicinus marinus]NYZ64437.1 signal recognition particle-docking protein FtsY [Spartinivicinus marinus]
MFGSRKGKKTTSNSAASPDEQTVNTDQEKPKKRFWQFGRKHKQEATAEQVEAKAEQANEQPTTVEQTVTSNDASTVVENAETHLPVDDKSTVEAVQAAESLAKQAATATETIETNAAEPIEQPSTQAQPNTVNQDVAPASLQQTATATEKVTVSPTEPSIAEALAAKTTEEQAKPKKAGFFSRMKKGLSKTRSSFVEGVTTLFIGKKEIDDDLLEELETQLLMADVGIAATTEIVEGLTQRIKYKELDDADALLNALKKELRTQLEPSNEQLVIDESKQPYVILVVGVNGVGKTTTIGKLAKRLQLEDKKVMLAAGDTFRAAAVEQLQVWGDRNEIPVIAQHTGADSASVIYDAVEAAKARNVDVLIADTAGRLHNKDNLMEELKKVKRVIQKLDGTAPHEVMLVVDACTGQNALSQAKQFNQWIDLTGMVLTKLDGTAKGGIVFALAQEMKLPIRFVGVGEQIDDLRPFNADEFVDALFDMEKLA